MALTFWHPIPPQTIVLWDAKYRRPGGSYPSLSAAKVKKWWPEIRRALNAPGTTVTGKIAGANFKHVNGALGELNGHAMLVAAGHYSILEPGRTTAGGVDFITYYHGPVSPLDWQIAVESALKQHRVEGRIFRWPGCIVTR
ncbi:MULTISPECIES: hypothetical protein [Rhodocyclales]|uniref:hypothetical protein n=1 Tax=Rhodocyclales TaxID=206389 RepID=UPI00129288BF|nr:hypothetical protein [Dechloromonas sp. H13]